MGKTLTPRQSWFVLLVTAAGFAALLLSDQPVAGFVLLAVVVMAGVVRLLWQAFTEGPEVSKEARMEDASPRCCICDAEYDPEKPHGSLTVSVEHVDKRAWIDTLDAVEIAACCRPACFEELWGRLQGTFPNANFEHAETSLEVLTRGGR